MRGTTTRVVGRLAPPEPAGASSTPQNTWLDDRRASITPSRAVPRDAVEEDALPGRGDPRYGSIMHGEPPRDGEHRIEFSDGSLSGIEHYSGGVKDGTCEYWYRNGQKKAEGRFTDGELAGHWIWWRENGERLQEGDFADGVQHGFWRRWHDTGALMDEGQWVAGKRSGEWRYYDKQGGLRKVDQHPLR
jgi:hypothetical protein